MMRDAIRHLVVAGLRRRQINRAPAVPCAIVRSQPLGVGAFARTRAAQDEGLAGNSPEMIEAVRTELEPAYGSWGMFAEWLPLNIEGLLRIWAETGATAATPAP